MRRLNVVAAGARAGSRCLAAVAVGVRLRPRNVRNLFLGARRNRLILLDLRNVGLVRTRDGLVRRLFVICVHGDSLCRGRSQSKRMAPLLARRSLGFRARRHLFGGNDVTHRDALDAAYSLDDHRMVVDAEQWAQSVRCLSRLQQIPHHHTCSHRWQRDQALLGSRLGHRLILAPPGGVHVRRSRARLGSPHDRHGPGDTYLAPPLSRLRK